jgi:hypothetical protein
LPDSIALLSLVLGGTLPAAVSPGGRHRLLVGPRNDGIVFRFFGVLIIGMATP